MIPRAEGVEVVALAKRRSGQDFFRRMIVASYDESCALSGIGDRRLLVASHIVRWADERARRLDPTNGICLNPLLDRAFSTPGSSRSATTCGCWWRGTRNLGCATTCASDARRASGRRRASCPIARSFAPTARSGIGSFAPLA